MACLEILEFCYLSILDGNMGLKTLPHLFNLVPNLLGMGLCDFGTLVYFSTFLCVQSMGKWIILQGGGNLF